MNDNAQNEIIAAVTKNILNTLSRQDFADWYNGGRFDAYIQGNLGEFGTESLLVAETLIKQDIQRLFNLV